jgi:hypothetical protein
MAANFRNRISMQPMRVRSWSEGVSVFFLWGEGRVGFFFQVVFGVQSGLYTVHFPRGKWTVDSPFKFLTCS